MLLSSRSVMQNIATTSLQTYDNNDELEVSR